jgi:hypothetical protein
MYSDPLSWQHGLIGAVLLSASIAVYGCDLLARQIAKFRSRRPDR